MKDDVLEKFLSTRPDEARQQLESWETESARSVGLEKFRN